MPDDETPVTRTLQQALQGGGYADLYPSLRGRLKAILASDDPALKAKAAAFVAMAARRGRDQEAWLRECYRLTPTEARLAAYIGAGGAIVDYALLHGVAEGTARTHLKAVFAKTGAHRQSDLVRLLAAGNR
jgi:DNA-binding CsgD family transcriptional regulator